MAFIELDIKEKEGIILTNVAAIKVTKGVNSLISLPEKVKKIIINKIRNTVVTSKNIFGW